MRPAATQSIEAIAVADEPAVLELNNAHAPEVGAIGAARLHELVANAFYARRMGALDAFLIAFDETADYDSLNFLWFRQRYLRFVYVDRVVVRTRARELGLGRQLYRSLYEYARARGHDIIACEVNLDPPNVVSDAFHESEGFTEVGRMLNPQSAKTVRYLVHKLTAQASAEPARGPRTRDR
jgi:hypothetical protein